MIGSTWTLDVNKSTTPSDIKIGLDKIWETRNKIFLMSLHGENKEGRDYRILLYRNEAPLYGIKSKILRISNVLNNGFELVTEERKYYGNTNESSVQSYMWRIQLGGTLTAFRNLNIITHSKMVTCSTIQVKF